MVQTSDVVVIGGGIIGLAVAYSLGRARVSVTLVERGAVGREASWAAAGYWSAVQEDDSAATHHTCRCAISRGASHGFPLTHLADQF